MVNVVFNHMAVFIIDLTLSERECFERLKWNGLGGGAWREGKLSGKCKLYNSTQNTLQISSKIHTYPYINMHEGKDWGGEGKQRYLLWRRQQLGRRAWTGQAEMDKYENRSTLLVPNLLPMVKEIKGTFFSSSALLHLKNSRELIKPFITIVQWFTLPQPATMHHSWSTCKILFTLTPQGRVITHLNRSTSSQSTYTTHPSKMFSNDKHSLQMWAISHGCTAVVRNG